MKTINPALLLLAICTLSLALFACKPDLITQPDPSFQAVNSWLAEHKATITCGLPDRKADMEQAFKQGYILIYAEGLPKKDVEHAGQKRLTAIRAAEIVAQRDLAHVLSREGRYASVRFDSYSAPLKTVVRDFRIVVREYNSEMGKAAVLLRYDLRGAKQFNPKTAVQ